ncbi:light-regulated signal transduction histidine kinase (bacteriophytochrome)/CheY-like chemotaxis protein [Ancylobacter sp. 3268]|uniref:HWE histidine kinase domain-containing protein n=1 Tax=Ancylobacter sp. 3268 TaxID=2817752 RepID=UPI00285C0D77|nr:HWE histidine kinase domain-containing protein [Ancylobacter sp. 3268]MDR6954340.1 light-regulated signal transduction histidine kinase (bacteriophytochrome)/CheY-like chemotaxis protein [Ancylobacter sp. 3268]
MSSPEVVDLTNCDREPIHIPGSTQPHGCLVVSALEDGRLLRWSSNAPAFLVSGEAMQGRRLAELVGEDAAARIGAVLADTREGMPPRLMFGVATDSGARFDVAVHRSGGAGVVEFERHSDEHGPALDIARTMIAQIANEISVEELLTQTPRVVREALGYDRVMVYRFAQDGAGQVVGEARAEELESFLGQWFPASDIPQQARELYKRNIIRVIGNAGGERCSLVPEHDDHGRPLDLSHAHLRSVSPIHLEYLRNMGVAASMSISVLVDGALWGLIACHHYSPRVLPMAQRAAAEMFGAFFALHLHALKQKRTLEVATAARGALDRFLRLASHHADVGELLRANIEEFAALMPCDGVGLWLGGEWTAHGSVPPASAMPELAAFLGGQVQGRVWSSDSLVELWPPAESFWETAVGVLALPLSQLPRDYLLFFRREIVQTLAWAGRPEKHYETGPHGDRLTPRKSFAIWKETVRRRASPWTDADREIAEAARSALVEIVLRHNELMAEERDKADTRQRLLNEELNHRVKNILAVIKSLVEHSVQDGRTVQDYVASLRGRIQALALAHDQVVRGAGGGALVDLLRAELSPYEGAASRTSLGGPMIWLDARAFSVMALVLHELSTNAAKYGAFSRPGGHVEVRWSVDAAGDCEILWRERGGPPVARPGRSGFGTALIERSIPYDLGGESEMRYEASGFSARLKLPARHIATSEIGAEDWSDGSAAAAAEPVSLADAAVLLVEDQMIIAMDVEFMMNDAGITRITTAASAADALRKLKDATPDIAVLDVNLGSGTSAPVAEELGRRGVPFVFATGYGDRSMIPPDSGHARVLAKPYDRDTLIAALRELYGARGQPPAR